MPYEDTLLRTRLEKRGAQTVARVQRDLPETEREKQARMNPQVQDITDHPPLFATTIANLTT